MQPHPPETTPETEMRPDVSLVEGFRQLRIAQEANGRRHKRGRRRKRHLTIAAIPLIFLVAVAIAVGPILYRTAAAYRDVFVEPAPRPASPFEVTTNPDGSKAIVPAGSTAVATASATGTPAISDGTGSRRIVVLNPSAAAKAESTPPEQTPSPVVAPSPVDPKAAAAALPAWNGTDRVTLLLIGVDRRPDDYARSDTMILVNFDPVSKSASMLSIPRDLKVIVPGYGVHKMNAAYAFGDANDEPGGGPGLTMLTIEANLGLRVDYFAEVDFSGFVEIVDTVGGVTLDVPYPIKDDAYPGPGNQYKRIYFPAGWQHMDGDRVLEYARTRHDDGDINRSRRQQEILLALRQQALTLDLLPKSAELIGELANAVRTDLQPRQALMLARLSAEIDPAAIVQYSLFSALTEEELPDQPYFFVADWDAVGAILSEFAGTPVVPPMSALAHPDFAQPVQIRDASGNPGLGDRVKALLEESGFTEVTIEGKDTDGTTTVVSAAEELTTAYLVAGLVGVPIESITVTEDLAGSIPENQSGTLPILIQLGPDASDPQIFAEEPFVDAPIEEVWSDDPLDQE